MPARIFAFLFLLSALPQLRAQEMVVGALREGLKPDSVDSAWIDLRQTAAANTKYQNAPNWVEAVTLVNLPAKEGVAATTVFRIRLARPRPDLQLLMFRLFFEDKSDFSPRLIAWDESGTEVLQSAPLGNGLNLPSAETVMIPMNGTSTVDVEVPGDGRTVRGAYLDWMTNTAVLHPMNVEHRDLIPEPFAAAAPLHAPTTDTEKFGAVTATLAAETIRIGPSVQAGAAFQFPLESPPLAALLTFEVAAAKIDSPPEVYVNGEDVGAVTLTLPELADPAYRGEMRPIVNQMSFVYTGWIRAQKLVPAASLKSGMNDLLVINGAGTSAAAVRSTQIELKYLWDKADYQLVPENR